MEMLVGADVSGDGRNYNIGILESPTGNEVSKETYNLAQ